LSRNSTRSCDKLLITKGGVPKPNWPPDPEKQSPGAAVTATRAKKKCASVTSKQPRINTRRRPEQEAHRNLSVYDGRRRLGTIRQRGEQFFVVLADGILLGAFASLKLASAEITAAHGGGR
jgi:hypothetical protein